MSATNQGPNPWSSQGLDPDLVDSETYIDYESEILIARRAFATAQSWMALFTTAVQTFSACSLHWHGTTVDPNEGSFAVVRSGSRLLDLVGEIVRVTVAKRSVFAYVVAESGQISTEITLARRPFMAVGRLAQPFEGITGQIEVMQ